MAKRKFGDRRDGRRVSDVTGLQTVMMHILAKRTECEVSLSDKIDVTELVKFIDAQNLEHPNYKTTIFHCFIYAVAKTIRERPYMNRFIQGRRMYERDEISLSFVAKRRFADGADESLMVLVPKDDENISNISRKIYGDVTEMRKSEHSTGGIDSVIDGFAKFPRWLNMLLLGIVKKLDWLGINPKFLTDGDTNYTTVLLSNLGSIGAPSVYHHLNNYGTNSIMITVGTLHKEELTMEDGHKEIRDVIDYTATLDERIADGFYFARSLKLVKYIFAHPEMLNEPLGNPSGFEFK